MALADTPIFSLKNSCLKSFVASCITAMILASHSCADVMMAACEKIFTLTLYIHIQNPEVSDTTEAK